MPKKTELAQFIEQAYANEKGRIQEELIKGQRLVQTATPLFGYAPSSWFMQFGAVCAFLYERRGHLGFAQQARDALFYYRNWTQELLDTAKSLRPEYAVGIPPIEPVFQPVVFIPAVQRIRKALNGEELASLVSITADGLRSITLFPEWGGHNRAMLRAAGLALAAQAFPDHSEASQWAELADELAEESWGRWSIEDAMLYQPHWLRALILYAQARDRVAELIDLVQPRMYLKAAAQLLSPLGVLPDFGDSHWLMDSHWEWMACLEWGAAVYQDAALKWAAQRIFETLKQETPTAGHSTVAMLAWQWCDDAIKKHPPINPDDALDDLVHKKFVWRTGWDSQAAYACLNYRDEGDYAKTARDYLRNTLAVSAEKMHHGHADEGSVCLLAHQGTLLLHESGYRESPPDGVYRSAAYHNRVVWREGRRPSDLGLVEFLRGDGAYQPVRTQRLYQTGLKGIGYRRVCITDEHAGVEWDRSVVFLPHLPCWIVVDAVRALFTAYRTISALWWTTDILEGGETWWDTHISGVQNWRNRNEAALWIGMPPIPEQTGAHSVEPFRRHFQDELALANTWAGEHREGRFIHFASVLWPHSYGSGAGDRPKAVELLASQPPGRGIGLRLNWQGEESLFGILSDLDCGFGQEDVRPTYTPASGLAQYGALCGDGAFVAWQKTPEREWAGFINGSFLAKDGQVYYQGKPHGMFQENRTAQPGVPRRFRWAGEVSG